MSASSSAATGAHLFRSYWIEHGAHKFIEMADSSVAVSLCSFQDQTELLFGKIK
jgi:hypothetical protein